MKTLLSACACAILLLAGPAQAGLFGKEKNNPNDVDPNAVLTVADFVKVSGKGKLTGMNQVAIPNFFVQFVSDQTIELKGRLGADSYTTQVRGIDDATLQTIADALYDGFAEELKAAGIEVIATETLEATKDFAEIRKAARVSPYTEESSTGGGKRDEKHQGVSTLVSARNLPINVRNTIDDYWLTANASDGFKVSLVDRTDESGTGTQGTNARRTPDRGLFGAQGQRLQQWRWQLSGGGSHGHQRINNQFQV